MSLEQLLKSEEQILVRNEIENTQEYFNTLEDVREKLLLLFTQTVNVNVKFENKNTIVLKQGKVFSLGRFTPYQYTKNQKNLPNEIQDIDQRIRHSDTAKHLVYSGYFRSGKTSVLEYLVNHCSDSECQYILVVGDSDYALNDLSKRVEKSLTYALIQQRKHLVLCYDEYICTRGIRDKLHELYDKIAKKYNCIVSVIAVIHQNYGLDLAELPEAKDGLITRTVVSEEQIKEYLHEALFPFTLPDTMIQEMYQLYGGYYFPYTYLLTKLYLVGIYEKEGITNEIVENEMKRIIKCKDYQDEINKSMYKNLTI